MVAYFVDATGGSDGNAGTSEGAPWQTLTKVNSFTFVAGDSIAFKRGETWRGPTLTGLESGTDGNPITLSEYSTGNLPVLSGADDLTDTAVYRWIASGSGTNEWYVELLAGGDPSLTQPNQTFLDGVRMLKGTIGALADHEWVWGDNDTLGFSTVYLADATGDPDTSGQLIEASQRNTVIGLDGEDWLTFDQLRLEKGHDSNAGGGSIFAEGGSAGIVIQNCVIADSFLSAIAYFDGATASGAWTITGNDFDNCGGTCIEPKQNSTGWTINDNTFHDSAVLDEHADHDFTAAIRFTGDAANIVCYDNTILDMGNGTATASGAGIWPDGAGLGVEIYDNIIHDCTYQGIRLEADQNQTLVHHNVIWNCSSGIALAANLTDGIADNEVYHNTIHNCSTGISLSGTDSEASSITGNLIKNNIIHDSTSRAIIAFHGGENAGGEGSGNIYLNNLIDPEQADMIEYGLSTTYATVAAWESAVADSAEVGGNFTGDPVFVNETTDVYRIQNTSPALDVGVVLSGFNDLFTGTAPDDGFAEKRVQTLTGSNSIPE